MSVEIAWKQNILVTDFHLLKSLLVVLGFGSQAFICGFSRQNINSVTHSVVVSLWDVTEPLYIEILRSDGPQKILADVDLTHLKSYWVIHTISIAVLGHSKSLWVIYFVSSHPKSSWVIKTSYVRGPPIQNPIYCDSVVTTTTVCNRYF